MKTKYLYLTYLLTLSLIFAAVIYAVTELTITNQGTVNVVGVESDVSSVDWGTLNPGDVATQIVRFRRTGNVDVTLSITVQNWIPSNAPNYFTVSWNYTNQPVSTSWLPVEFTLTVASNTTLPSFNFDIYVVAV